jgi:hypothetical protein
MVVVADNEYKAKRARLMFAEGREIVGLRYPKLACSVGQKAVGDGNPAHGNKVLGTPEAREN